MAHLCRTLFPTILETEGLLFKLLSDSFAYSKFLYDDLVKTNSIYSFKDYIYSLIDVEKKEIITNRTVEDLLDEAGYILYKCNTQEDILSFSKYYAKNEELCTFNDNRLDRCYVFFAVKKDVEKIRREDFLNPQRQDIYGTSVISIQFTKGKVNTLSIKNRYNHRVNHPDATFNNNLDNIILGLTDSFEKQYKLNINSSDKYFFLPGYVLANGDGKLYKYNYEINNKYYCPNNIIIDNYKVVDKYSLDKARYIVFDYFVLDLQEKKLIKYDSALSDSFTDSVCDINKVSVVKGEDNFKHIIINTNSGDIEIIINKLGQMVGYKNNIVEKIGDDFCKYNTTLEKLELNNVKLVGDNFLYRNNRSLKDINMPSVEELGNQFLFSNNSLSNISFPNVKKCKDKVMYYGHAKTINMENVLEIGDDFCKCNDEVLELNFPNLRTVGSNFCYSNSVLKRIHAPNLINFGKFFLPSVEKLEDLVLNPNVSDRLDYLSIKDENKGRGSL